VSGAEGFAARKAAAKLLTAVIVSHDMLSDVAEASLDPRDRARALSVAGGVLRHMERLDQVLDPMVDRMPPTAVRNVLRIAAYEVLIDGVAAYAAIDGAVRQMQAGKHRKFAGLVNAVGRRITREGPEALAAAAAPALPSWMAKPITRAWGEEAAAAIAAAHLVAPATDLTLKNPDQAESLAQALEADLLPTASLRLHKPSQISLLPGFETGDWWVQDAAAALPVRLLGDIAGADVVDLCAAPGGKTMQLAALGAKVTAVDMSDKRLARVQENLERTGLTAQVVAADAQNWAPESAPDIVVLDAPCSATGTLRRHPDLPLIRPAPDLSPLLELQEALIDRALSWLPPGGRLLYCTCSLLPREGETQITRARDRHPDLIEGAHQPEGTAPDWWLPSGGLRLRPDFWPDRGGMDGFFATVLTKPG